MDQMDFILDLSGIYEEDLSALYGDENEHQPIETPIVDLEQQRAEEPEEDIEATSDVENIEDLKLSNFSGDIKGSLVGVRAKEWGQLYQLYKNHSNALGFGIVKTTEHKNVAGQVMGKYFQCNCFGTTKSTKNKVTSTPKPVKLGEIIMPSPIQIDQEENLTKSKRKRRTTIKKCNCKAKMRVKYLKEEGVFSVQTHVLEHTHEMTKTYWNHYKKSERSISIESGSFIQHFDAAGIKPKDGYNVLVKAAGGEEYVGHTRKDYANYLQKMRTSKLEKGDVQNLLRILKNKKLEDPDFYYEIELGDDLELKHIFIRDGMMKKDFMLYGDVVIFDTTYNTNRYGMICAPLVGINNHWNTVMFGLGFLTNEVQDTFAWLLREFVKSMGGKEPETIFTDQDAAMSAAIKEVFEDRTKHRLCIWHIQQNVVSHFGALNGDKEFKAKFDHCLMGCMDEKEFEECWKELMDKFDLWDESWFKRLYGIKGKWCTGLSKDFFSAGILSSQRSESTNHAIKFDIDRTASLSQFLEIYDKTVHRWRSEEQKKEFESINCKPQPELYGGIINHAAAIYTIEIFKFFEHETKAAFAASYTVCQLRNPDDIVFKIAHERNPERSETVHYLKNPQKPDDVILDCSCNQFSSVGWLCFHCIKVLNLNNIEFIPARYILKRWTRTVKMSVWDATYQGRTGTDTIVQESLPWRQYMARKFYDLLLTSENDHTAKRILEDSFNVASLQIQEHLSSKSLKLQKKNKKGPSVGSSTMGNGVLNPSTVTGGDENIPPIEHYPNLVTPTSDKRKWKKTKSLNEIISSPQQTVRDPKPAITKGAKKKTQTSKFDKKRKLADIDFGTATRNEHLI